MFTPRRLFGNPGQPSDLLHHLPFLNRARAEREHGRELPSRVALGGYLAARLAERLLAVSLHCQEERESFFAQLESTQRYVAELPGSMPEVLHLDGIVRAVAEAAAGADASLKLGLGAYGHFLEHEGRFEEALDVVSLTGRAHGAVLGPAEYTRLALVAAKLNRLLARWDAANASYAAAEEGARAAADESGTLRAQLGRALVLRGRGDLPAARSGVEQVLTEAKAAGLTEICSMAYLELGAVSERQDRTLEALQSIYAAFLHTEDPSVRTRVLGDLGVMLARANAGEAARMAFDIVLRSNATFAVAMNARLELMDLESSSGNQLGFERCRQVVSADAARMPPSMAIDFRFKVASGFARFGMLHRAETVLQEGLELAEEHGLNQWYFKLETLQRGLANASAPRAAEPAEAKFAPAVAEVADGLRQLSASMA